MSVRGPTFVPPHRDEYYAIISERYHAALAEAQAIGAAKNIEMRVESLRPVHLNLSNYTLPTGDTLFTIQDNCAIFPYGLLDLDSTFDYIKWYQGNKVEYIGDWFVLPIRYFEEQMGAYTGNVAAYEWRAGESFDIYVHSTTTPLPSTVSAWLYGFIVCPRTMADSKIIK